MLSRAKGIQRVIEADVEAVDRECLDLRSGLLANLAPEDRFAVELLLREALTNAIFHGGSVPGRKRIRYEVSAGPEGVLIRVADGGSGFDWSHWMEKTLPPVEEYGMGLQILHRYASRVRYSANGSEVELMRTIQEGRKL
jgi:anti-sigma regulatory factor (Ser/Thr protein kinase)